MKNTSNETKACMLGALCALIATGAYGAASPWQGCALSGYRYQVGDISVDVPKASTPLWSNTTGVGQSLAITAWSANTQQQYPGCPFVSPVCQEDGQISFVSLNWTCSGEAKSIAPNGEVRFTASAWLQFKPGGNANWALVPNGQIVVDGTIFAPGTYTLYVVSALTVTTAFEARFALLNFGSNQPSVPQCLADLFVDHQVNGADLGILLSQWGPASSAIVSDINRDGIVDGADLGYLLNAWGPCPN
jgi:hypothetical protein